MRAGKAILGVVPTDRTIVAERFFDEAGGMQLILHTPFGARINRAWGLALRKKFCRSFNVELQAAATDNGICLSLTEQHAFALDVVFEYVKSASVEHTLTQALLDAPVFAARWRWNATRSLTILRSRAGKKVAPQLQRMRADDLLAAVFPDQAACAENLSGPVRIPDHVLVRETIDNCLREAARSAPARSTLRSRRRSATRSSTRTRTRTSTMRRSKNAARAPSRCGAPRVPMPKGARGSSIRPRSPKSPNPPGPSCATRTSSTTRWQRWSPCRRSRNGTRGSRSSSRSAGRRRCAPTVRRSG